MPHIYAETVFSLEEDRKQLVFFSVSLRPSIKVRHQTNSGTCDALPCLLFSRSLTLSFVSFPFEVVKQRPTQFCKSLRKSFRDQTLHTSKGGIQTNTYIRPLYGWTSGEEHSGFASQECSRPGGLDSVDVRLKKKKRKKKKLLSFMPELPCAVIVHGVQPADCKHHH